MRYLSMGSRFESGWATVSFFPHCFISFYKNSMSTFQPSSQVPHQSCHAHTAVLLPPDLVRTKNTKLCFVGNARPQAELFLLCTHNFFGHAQCYAQLFWLGTSLHKIVLVRHTVMHNVFGNAHRYIQLCCLVRTSLNTTFLVMHNVGTTCLVMHFMHVMQIKISGETRKKEHSQKMLFFMEFKN